jgi:hypothetical protein
MSVFKLYSVCNKLDIQYPEVTKFDNLLLKSLEYYKLEEIVHLKIILLKLGAADSQIYKLVNEIMTIKNDLERIGYIRMKLANKSLI